MIMVDIDVQMTKPQQELMTVNTRELLVEGSAGSGKTKAACFKVVFYCLRFERASVYVYRKTLPSLKRTAWKEIREILYNIVLEYDSDGNPSRTLYDVCHENKSEGTIEFPNKSKIYFGALDELSKVRSINADVIYIEQAEELTNTAFYTELMLRLGRGHASKTPEGYSQMILVVQPEEEEHWIYKRYHEFYDATNAYERQKREIEAYNRKHEDSPQKVRTYDDILNEIKERRTVRHFHYSTNDFLPQFQKDYYDDLKNEDYDLWLRYSAGEWGKLSDVVYTNWDTVVPDVLNHDFISFGADFGFNNPSCFLLLKWYDNEVYVVDEVYERGLTNTEFIDAVDSMLFENKLLPEHLGTGYGDKAEPDRIKEFNQRGYKMVGGVKDVNAKIMTTKQTRIHIHPQCVNTLKEIKSYKYRKNRDGVVTEDPIPFNDHCMDALGYAVYGVRGYLSPRKPFKGNFEDTLMVF